jgi:hypothetical protein
VALAVGEDLLGAFGIVDAADGDTGIATTCLTAAAARR